MRLEICIDKRPIVCNAVIGIDAEVLRPETGRKGRPVDRSAADTIAERRLDRRAIVFKDNLRATPQIGIGAQWPLGQTRPRGCITRYLLVVLTRTRQFLPNIWQLNPLGLIVEVTG